MTSNNVIEFPTKDVKVAQLTEQVTEAMGELEVKYNELDALHEMLNQRELDANNLEKEYDVIIKQYIDEVGIKNTPALWLTYSRSCVMKAKAEGEYEMIWLGTEDEDE